MLLEEENIESKKNKNRIILIVCVGFQQFIVEFQFFGGSFSEKTWIEFFSSEKQSNQVQFLILNVLLIFFQFKFDFTMDVLLKEQKMRFKNEENSFENRVIQKLDKKKFNFVQFVSCVRFVGAFNQFIGRLNANEMEQLNIPSFDNGQLMIYNLLTAGLKERMVNL